MLDLNMHFKYTKKKIQNVFQKYLSIFIYLLSISSYLYLICATVERFFNSMKNGMTDA